MKEVILVDDGSDNSKFTPPLASRSISPLTSANTSEGNVFIPHGPWTGKDEMESPTVNTHTVNDFRKKKGCVSDTSS